MKQYAIVGIIILLAIMLVGCAASKKYPSTKLDLSKEAWMSQVDNNPALWIRGADTWFLTGNPNPAELLNRRASYRSAISTMQVKVPNFTDIKVSGDFQVQIFGTEGPNSVYINGSNAAVRLINVEVQGSALCINQVAKNPSMNMKSVIIRIGVRNLRKLIVSGCASVEGVQIRSGCLYVNTLPNASGAIFLAGLINVRQIDQRGTGCITIFGAQTPTLDIKSSNTGRVRVQGNVGIRSIVHSGLGDVSVIGANSNNLKIHTTGAGKISISGPVNLQQVQAKNNTRVFITNVQSDYVYAYALDKAVIGLIGRTKNLYADTACAAFFAGRYLCAENAYARARDVSHINVTASTKIFASAQQNASVYFFGSPKLLSQFVSGNGVVIPIWGGGAPYCGVVQTRPISYKGEAMGYTPRSLYRKRRPQFVGAG